MIDDLPYVHATGDGGRRPVTQMIVIHATDNTASASAEVAFASWREDRTSAHFYVDEISAYRALPLDNIAYGCFPMGNTRSVQFELCGRSNFVTDRTLRRAAPLVAEACKRYGLPIRKLSATDLVNGVPGICGHGDVTAAWHQGDHTDPGGTFPWSTFIRYVQEAAGGTVSDPIIDEIRANVGKLIHQTISNDNGTVPGPIPAALARIEAGLVALAARPVGTVQLDAAAEQRIVDGVSSKLLGALPGAVVDEERRRLES